MDTICMVEDMESESSSDSDFSSYAESLYEDERVMNLRFILMLYMMRTWMMTSPPFVRMFKEDPCME